jgi:thiamine-phosphate pyrophosphorylase
MIDFKLYLITDRKLIADHYSLIAPVRQALKGGVKAIQLREKDLDTRELLKLAYKMRELTAGYDARLFINDRLDIARKVVKKKFMIGVSTHSLKEAKDAEEAGADFITLGPVYRTPSKMKYGKPLGTEVLKDVSRKIKVPVFAIGGIKGYKVSEVKKAGAYGVAMISEIFGSNDVKGKAREIIDLLENMN